MILNEASGLCMWHDKDPSPLKHDAHLEAKGRRPQMSNCVSIEGLEQNTKKQTEKQMDSIT